MSVQTDIDIDFSDRKDALEGLTYVLASETHKTGRRRHQSGVYFHDIPVDPLDGLAVWDYAEAESKGYFKLDLLHNTIYRDVRDEAHLLALLANEPPWHLFCDPEIICDLAHISEHIGVLQSVRPTSIEDLAICLALIRPGKRHLVGRPRSEIDAEIWCKTANYFFKKSHAVSYAVAIVVQLNLLIEKAWNVEESSRA